MQVLEDQAFPPIEPPSRRARRASLFALLGFVGLCLLVMAASGSVTVANTGGWYLSLRRPPGTPPSWVFGPVWFVLYVCMGVAAWLVWRRVEVAAHRKRSALRSWGWQLMANALWPPAFFGMHALGLGLSVILLMVGAIVVTMLRFNPIDRRAAWLMGPYLAWVGYALYLNAGFWWLNTG